MVNSHVKAFVLLILIAYIQNIIHNSLTEAATQWCSYEKKFLKYATNLQEKTHAEVWFQ